MGWEGCGGIGLHTYLGGSLGKIPFSGLAFQSRAGHPARRPGTQVSALNVFGAWDLIEEFSFRLVIAEFRVSTLGFGVPSLLMGMLSAICLGSRALGYVCCLTLVGDPLASYSRRCVRSLNVYARS